MGGDFRESESGRFWKIQDVRKWIPVVAYAAFLFYLSSQSSLNVPSFTLSDKMYHVGAYAIFGFLIARAVGKKYLLVAFLGATLYGFSDEFHQWFVPGRSAEFFDLVADAIGGFLGGVVFKTLRPWRFFSLITE